MKETNSHLHATHPAEAEDISGPAPVDDEHFDALIRLLDLVMRPDTSRSMTDDFPFFLRRENLDNLLVCCDGDRVVSHVGLLPMKASYFGCGLRIGMIGAVATHPDYRRRGLATRTLLETFRRFRRQGGHLLMISGRRGLYSRNGAREVGSFRRYVQERANAISCGDEGLFMEKAGSGRASDFAALHRLKPVRFLRPLEEWMLRMDEGVCRNRLSEFCMTSRGGQPTAYVIFRIEEVEGNTECVVTEWAGTPRDALLAVSRRMREEGWARAIWTLYPHERRMAAVLKSHGAHFSGNHAADGSLKIANFPALTESLRDYFGELVGEEVANSLEFQRRGPTEFSMGCGEENVTIEGEGELVEAVFGKGLETTSERGPGNRMMCALSEILPLSPMNYDFSYA